MGSLAKAEKIKGLQMYKSRHVCQTLWQALSQNIALTSNGHSDK